MPKPLLVSMLTVVVVSGCTHGGGPTAYGAPVLAWYSDDCDEIHSPSGVFTELSLFLLGSNPEFDFAKGAVGYDLVESALRCLREMRSDTLDVTVQSVIEAEITVLLWTASRTPLEREINDDAPAIELPRDFRLFFSDVQQRRSISDVRSHELRDVISAFEVFHGSRREMTSANYIHDVESLEDKLGIGRFVSSRLVDCFVRLHTTRMADRDATPRLLEVSNDDDPHRVMFDCLRDRYEDVYPKIFAVPSRSHPHIRRGALTRHSVPR